MLNARDMADIKRAYKRAGIKLSFSAAFGGCVEADIPLFNGACRVYTAWNPKTARMRRVPIDDKALVRMLCIALVRHMARQ